MAEDKPVWRLLTPELDEHLALIEQQNRGLISRFDRAECCPGVLISHEGEWALRRSPPGSTIRECSLGSLCEAPGGDHITGRESCQGLPGGCPRCEEELRRADL